MYVVKDDKEWIGIMGNKPEEKSNSNEVEMERRREKIGGFRNLEVWKINGDEVPIGKQFLRTLS